MKISQWTPARAPTHSINCLTGRAINTTISLTSKEKLCLSSSVCGAWPVPAAANQKTMQHSIQNQNANHQDIFRRNDSQSITLFIILFTVSTSWCCFSSSINSFAYGSSFTYATIPLSVLWLTEKRFQFFKHLFLWPNGAILLMRGHSRANDKKALFRFAHQFFIVYGLLCGSVFVVASVLFPWHSLARTSNWCLPFCHHHILLLLMKKQWPCGILTQFKITFT